MKDSNFTIWWNFRIAFKKNIEALDLEYLAEKLKEPSERKYFLKYDLCNRIAKDMQLLYKEDEEYLKIDYTLFKEGEAGWRVPIIFIESENDHESTYEEVLKLCSVNAQLKVLVIYGLSEAFEKELVANESYWDYILKDYMQAHTLTGHFAVMIYDWTDKLRFYSKLYTERGMLLEPKSLFVER